MENPNLEILRQLLTRISNQHPEWNWDSDDIEGLQEYFGEFFKANPDSPMVIRDLQISRPSLGTTVWNILSVGPSDQIHNYWNFLRECHGHEDDIIPAFLRKTENPEGKLTWSLSLITVIAG